MIRDTQSILDPLAFGKSASFFGKKIQISTSSFIFLCRGTKISPSNREIGRAPAE
jgi:hypothetical protein